MDLSGRISPPDIPPVVDQFANRGLKKSTRCSSRLSMSASSLSSCSSSSSAYSSASSSCLQPSLMEEEESFCPPPSAPPPLSKSGKSTKKATRSSVRLSVAPCPQEEWRSLPTKPGVLKLSRLPATDASSPSLNSSDSSMSCSTSLNSSRGGKGELGTRGLSKVGSRARKQLLKQVEFRNVKTSQKTFARRLVLRLTLLRLMSCGSCGYREVEQTVAVTARDNAAKSVLVFKVCSDVHLDQ